MSSDKPDRKKTRNQIPQSMRFNVFRRDNFTCRYCGKSSPEVVLHCDHAVSVKDGGDDSAANLVTACIDCNLGKSAQSVAVTSALMPACTPPEGLLGMWGHTLDSDGEISWQFKVVRKIDPGVFICQLFSWLTGDPTNCEAIPLEKLLAGKLYDSFEQMDAAFQKICDQKREARRGLSLHAYPV